MGQILSRHHLEAGAELLHGMRRWIFPDQCPQCGELTDGEGGLCGPCWRDTPFLMGLVCDQCGVGLLGEPCDGPVQCDACREIERPWSKGRSVLNYTGGARVLVLKFKHGDRLDLAPTFARWMADRAAPLVDDHPIVVPVPIHRGRLLKRRYNQAAVLAHRVSRLLDLSVVPDALRRVRATAPLDDPDHDARREKLAGSVVINPATAAKLAGKPVLLVDDVMTTGATLGICAEALRAARVTDVRVLTLARAAPRP